VPAYPNSILSPKQMQELRTKVLAGTSTIEDVFMLIASHEILRAKLLVLREKVRSG
jgi:hypothetical protein